MRFYRPLIPKSLIKMTAIDNCSRVVWQRIRRMSVIRNFTIYLFMSKGLPNKRSNCCTSGLRQMHKTERIVWRQFHCFNSLENIPGSVFTIIAILQTCLSNTIKMSLSIVGCIYARSAGVEGCNVMDFELQI